MKIYYKSSLLSELKESFLFFDTNLLILALSQQVQFANLFDKLKKRNCAFLTIPSVFFEFSRGADSVASYNEIVDYFKKLVEIYPIQKHIDKMESEMLVLHKTNKSCDYTDFLLCLCLCKFRSAFLISENHKHIKSDIIDRVGLITADDGKEIRNLGVYSLTPAK